MPVNGPSDQLRRSSDVLETVRRQSAQATAELDRGWSGIAATSTVSTMSTLHRDTGQTSERGEEIASVTDTATEIIDRGYQQLAAVLDSFVDTVTRAGPAILTPVGFPVLMTIAERHLQVGSEVVARVRHDLSAETRKLQQVAEKQTDDQRRYVEHDRESLRARKDMASAASQASASDSKKSGDPGAAAGISSESLPSGAVRMTLPNGKVVTAPNEKAANAVRAALTQQGVPYVWGGTEPGKGLDCSGLTQYSYRQAGVELPRTAAEQAIGERVPPSQAEAGDLVVWSGHVAMALGDGTMIEAGDPVAISSMRTDNIGMEYMGIYRPTESATATA